MYMAINCSTFFSLISNVILIWIICKLDNSYILQLGKMLLLGINLVPYFLLLDN